MESAYATIEIGGTIKRSDIERFCAAAENDYANPDDFYPEGMLGAIQFAAERGIGLVLIGDAASSRGAKWLADHVPGLNETADIVYGAVNDGLLVEDTASGRLANVSER